MAETKEIISRFYDLHEKPSIIAKELNVRPSYVTKVIQKDTRYIHEKEYRTKLSKENRKKSKCEWIRNKQQNDKQLEEQMKLQHIQASKELSYSCKMSDISFAKWNRQMFIYDNNSSDLVLRKGFNYACDVPKRVSNVINPIQRRVIC